MDLNAIRDVVKTVNREVEFRPAGTPTGWFFTLRHESAAEVQEVTRRFQAKVRDLMLKRKSSAYQDLVAENEDKLRMAHVAGWRWAEGDDEAAGRPPYSREELKSLLDDKRLGYHVKAFIDEEVGDLKDFLEKLVKD